MKNQSDEIDAIAEEYKVGTIRRQMARYKIHVSERIINEATIADSGHCMIAEAVKESIPRATSVSVDLATVRFTDKTTGDRYIYMTPYYAQKALAQFDSGIKPEPFDFQLRTLFQIRPKSQIVRRTPVSISQELIKDSPDSEARPRAPVKIGGASPPRSILNPRIRRFGLRVLPQKER